MANEIIEKPVRSRTTPGAVRLQDIARHLGVHPMTVSRALSNNSRISEATRESVRIAAEEMGYRPNLTARSLRQGRNSKSVPLFAAFLDAGLNTQKIEAIQSLLSAEGYETPIHSCGFHNQMGPLQAEMLASLRAAQPAAIVCNSMLLTPPALEELRAWTAAKGVAVMYDHDFDIDCDRVIFDRIDASKKAVNHLLELGHTRIGYAHHSSVHGVDPRKLGVEQALGENGLRLADRWTLRADQPNKHTQGGCELAQQFLALPVAERPTALCIVNDLVALAFIAEVQKNGVRVPEDLSVVAHDDQPFAEFASVPLTTVTHPAEVIAQQVVRVLKERLAGSTEPAQRVVVQGQLIARASSSVCRRA